MRISVSTALLMASICLVPVAASAASGSYICAVSEVFECLAVTGCQRDELKDTHLSAFMVIDVDKKLITSASIGEEPRSANIAEGLSATDKALYIYGTQNQRTWNATVSLETGALVGGITSGELSFAFFGNCTPK